MWNASLGQLRRFWANLSLRFGLLRLWFLILRLWFLRM